MNNLKNHNVIRCVAFAVVERMEQRTLMSAAPISLDPAFGTAGVVNGEQTPAGVAQLTATNPVNGNVYVVGYAQGDEDGEIPYEVQQFTPSGLTVIPFGNNGIATSPTLATPDIAVVQPDGKILVLGDQLTTGNTGRNFFLTRFTAAGEVDTTFGTGGTVQYFGLYSPYSGSTDSFSVLPNGDIFVPGVVISNNVGESEITAYTSTGQLDNSFGTNGVAVGGPGSLSAVTIDASGTLIAVGSTSVSSTSPVGAVASGFIERFTAAGKLDTSFGNRGSIVAPNASTFSSAFVSSSGISASGYLATEDASSKQTVTLELNHFAPAGLVDTSFGAGKGYVSPQLGEYGFDTAYQSDGKLVIDLEFNAQGGAGSELVRLNTDGSLDTTFGTGGYDYNFSAPGLSLEPDNQIVSAIIGLNPSGLDFNARRLLINGSPDPSFGLGGVSAGRPLLISTDAIAELPNGQTLVAGDLTIEGEFGIYIQRYDSNGSLDSTFAPGQGYGGANGYIFVGPLQFDESPTVNELAVDTTGNIYLNEVGVGIFRFDSTGQVDKTFGTNGIVANASQSGFLVEANGQILDVAGATITRLNATGAVDTTFGTDGTVTPPAAFSAAADAMALQPNGDILIGGSDVSSTTGDTDLAVLRLAANGSVDASFGTDGIAIADQLPALPTGLAILPNETIALVGNAGFGPTVAEFLSTGKLNPGFGNAGQTPAYVPSSVPLSTVVGVVAQSDGSLVVTGTQEFGTETEFGFIPSSDSNLYVLRYNPDGSIDNVFTNQIIPPNPQDIGPANSIDAMAAGPNGTVIVAANLAPDDNSDDSPITFPGLARYVTDAPSSSTAPLTGTAIGSTGSYGGKGNTIENVFDDNFNTFFDAKQASLDWAGLDLGSAKTIVQISFAPRTGWESRMVGGVFQVSSTPNFTSDLHTIYTVTTAPIAGQFTTVSVSTGAYRYLRYLGPTNSYCNIAEAQFFAAPPKLSGTVIGTTGSYENQGNTIANVFDGNLSTFFDAPMVSGAWVGLDFGTAVAVTSVSFAPRDSNWSGFPKRMIGGEIQASNTADFSSGVVTAYTINTAPPVQTLTTVTLPQIGAYRYWRYIGPDGGSCNIAELSFVA